MGTFGVAGLQGLVRLHLSSGSWGVAHPWEWQWRGRTLGMAGLEARHQLLEEVARVRRGYGRGRLHLPFAV